MSINEKITGRNYSNNFPCVAILLMNLFFQQAFSLTTSNDVMVAARALGFMEKPLTGPITVGILYNANAPTSIADAKNISKILDGGLQVGDLTLNPILLPISDAKQANVELFFLAEDTGSNSANLSAIFKKRKILCVTADTRQVISGNCTLGVSSVPKIEILVNREVAINSGINFATAFRMMITEL